jgi:sugar phosphate isomerase/epimerase
MVETDQRADLLALGKRLVCLHIADNNGSHDEHLAPFCGTVDWLAILRTLKEIGYTGDLTYEIPKFTGNLPAAMRGSVLDYTVELGRYLIDCFTHC